MSHTEVCLFCSSSLRFVPFRRSFSPGGSGREGFRNWTCDDGSQSRLKDLLKAPLSFPAQANGFTFNGNVCTILHLMCSLFTCAPDGHPVRGDRAIGIETKQKFALRKHAFPAHFSHTVYWEDWEIHPFCIDSDDFQVLTLGSVARTSSFPLRLSKLLSASFGQQFPHWPTIW